MSVIITGVSCLTAHGHEPDHIWKQILANNAGYQQQQEFNAVDSKVSWAGCYGKVSVDDLPHRKIQKFVNRKDLLGIAAAHRALRDAARLETSHSPERAGVFVGSCSTQLGDFAPYFSSVVGCVTEDRLHFDSSRFGRECLQDINPIMAVKVLLNGCLAHISQSYDLRGENGNFMDPVTSGLQAVIAGYEAIASGKIDWCLVGGIFAPHEPFQVAQALHEGRLLTSSKSLPPTASEILPFSQKASGSLFGEAAAFLVLQSSKVDIPERASVYGTITSHQQSSCGRSDPEAALAGILNSSALSVDTSCNVWCDAAGHINRDAIYAKALERWSNATANLSVITSSPWLGWCGDAGGIVDIVLALTAPTQDVPLVLPKEKTTMLPKNISFQNIMTQESHLVLRSSPLGAQAAVTVKRGDR